MNYDAILIHYGELALKGGNRSRFEKLLVQNIRQAVKGHGLKPAERISSRMLLRLPPDTDIEPVLAAIAPLPGIVWYAPACTVERDIDKAEAVIREMARTDPRTGTFRVKTRRSDKSFEMDSMAVNRVLGSAVNEETGRPVDLTNAETTFGVAVLRSSFLLYCDRREGVGGLPARSAGRVLALMSGGIDSPVAAWSLMRRGVRVFFLHFHSRVTGDTTSLEKLDEICEVLAKTQGNLTSLVVPFQDLQREIIANVPAEWRMIVYRRTMFRVANLLAPKFEALAYVTGDSVSQVASQTLENLRLIHEVADRPVLTPLAGSDKTEIVDRARQIGTFEISSRPHTDCCSFMVSPHPQTHARKRDVDRFEANCRFEPYLEDAVEGVEKTTYGR